jgi:hypothetical protein
VIGAGGVWPAAYPGKTWVIPTISLPPTHFPLPNVKRQPEANLSRNPTNRKLGLDWLVKTSAILASQNSESEIFVEY